MGGHESSSQVRDERAVYSMNRVREFEKGLTASQTLDALPGLTVFAAGSYGRMEAGEHSDIDLFFMYDSSVAPGVEVSGSAEAEFFRAVREVADGMGFPEFTDGGKYLEIHRTDQVLERLGGRHDDYVNHFTARMLMLLESTPVARPDVYENVINAMVAEYSRDMTGHEDTFNPLFLINDVRRFWTTLLINYENGRNDAEKRMLRPAHRVKNYKLRISRLTTCFATIVAIESLEVVTIDGIKDILSKPPRRRLEDVRERLEGTRESLNQMFSIYDHFLDMTALSTEQIERVFTEENSRIVERESARKYGNLMFDVVNHVGEHSQTHRGYHLTRMLTI